MERSRSFKLSMPFPYQFADVSNGAVGGAHDLPFSPLSVGFGQSPMLVLGENGTVFASASTTTTINGVITPVDQIVSLSLSSGATNWAYQAGPQTTLSIIQATAGGGVTINASTSSGNEAVRESKRRAKAMPDSGSSSGVVQLDINGNTLGNVASLNGAVPFDFGSWVSTSGGLASLLWNPLGANQISTILANSASPMPGGNAQGQHQPPFCQRKNSNCVLAPNNDTVIPRVFPPGVNTREVLYEIFSLQNGNLVDMGASSQILQTKIMALESDATNPGSSYCNWQTPGGTRCVSPNSNDTAGWYTDDYSAGSTGTNTLTQQFFVDRGQVQIFWPTETSQGKIWYGAWEQSVTDLASPGAIITQTNPNMSNGATCNLHPPDPHGCSPIQANGTN
jgi:hypothetical protein